MTVPRTHASFRVRRLALVLAAGSLLVLAGCGEASLEPTVLEPAAADGRWNAATPAPSAAFSAHLAGAQEVPAVDTRAQGQALFRLSADGMELSYRLIVANIDDVLMAHIHMAPIGENGGVVAWLYPAGPPPQLIEGRVSGVLAEGTLTAADLVGDLAGETLESLVEAIEAGSTYVNVHTSAFPAGEVRGQIH